MMRYWILSIFFLANAAYGQRTCGLDEIIYDTKIHFPHSYQQYINELIDYSSIVQLRTNITLPVVVHIIYSDDENNISDFQVHSQIQVLNQSFSEGLFLDEEILPAHREKATVPNIQFQLACLDPEGQFTTGITRTKTPIPDMGSYRDITGVYILHHERLGGVNPWPTDQYINIWVVEMDDGLLGRASLPIPLTDPNREGLVINVNNFGFAGTAADHYPYNLGMTTVHEMGHYLGLRHPWGIGDPSCDEDDFVDDTPNQGNIYYDCPTEYDTESCSSSDMAKNIMGYVDDACLKYFTAGQVDLMKHTLYTHRVNLTQSSGLSNCTINPPEELLFWNKIDTREWIFSFPTSTSYISFNIYNMNGQKVSNGQVKNSQIIQIHLPQFPAGMYIVQIEYDGKTEIKKINLY